MALQEAIVERIKARLLEYHDGFLPQDYKEGGIHENERLKCLSLKRDEYLEGLLLPLQDFDLQQLHGDDLIMLYNLHAGYWMFRRLNPLEDEYESWLERRREFNTSAFLHAEMKRRSFETDVIWQ